MTATHDILSPSEMSSKSGLPSSIRLAFMALRACKKGTLRISLPDGQNFVFSHGQPGPEAQLHVKDVALVSRVLSAGDIGFAEAYMDDQFETPCLTTVLEFFAVNFEQAGRLGRGSPFKNAFRWLLNAVSRRNTKSGSKQNILAHYDLGNDFYETWLDPSMTYSSAMFQETDDLKLAQDKKYHVIAESVGAAPGKHLLEIGSGWGGFAEYATKTFDVNVTTITISDAQYEYAKERITRAGLDHKVDVQLCDYRDLDGQYDGVVSIEMFEAVGEEFWPSYFAKVSDVLKPGGKAGLQIITIDDDLFKTYRKRVDFIQKYIFPGGMLPSIKALKDQVSNAELTYESETMFGPCYARTLKLWNDQFLANWDLIQRMNFDTRFKRVWEFYLSYCEAGFRTGRTDVGQFVLQKPS